MKGQMATMSINQNLQDEYEFQIMTMLLGGNNKDMQEHILRHLCAEMFTNKYLRDVFKVVKDIYSSGNDINVANVCEVISSEDKKQLTIDLTREYITSLNCDFYLKKLLDNYIQRLVQTCDNLEGLKNIEKVKNRYSLNLCVEHISHNAHMLIPEYYDKWETSIKTGYPSIDKKLGTLQGGDVLILAGAAGMGKTCMMLNLLMNIAKNNHKILLFSLEMTLAQLQNRIISAETNINADKIRNFNMSDSEVHKYDEFATSEFFKNLKIDVSTKYDLTVEEIASIVKKSEAEIVFIDYLGLVSGDGKLGAYERVSEISRRLKLLALETNKPFIILHQLSRAIAERKDKRPQISDLRDSGKIEQDADFICFVYRPAYYGEKTTVKQELEFLIAKSRHSAGRAIVRLVYNGDKQKIIETLLDQVEGV